MQSNPRSILAVNPGTRYLGLAVFSGNQLKDWRVKILKGRWSKRKLQKALDIVSECVERYHSDVLVVKRLHPARTSRGLESFELQLRRIALRKRITLTRYSIMQLEEFFCREKKNNKRNLAQAVAASYPELYGEFNSEYVDQKPHGKKQKNPYHIKMFEAVALGAMCAHELDNN